MKQKQAVILAGGRGTRLKPYTLVFPKPLMPIGDTPILEILVRQLAQAGFREIVMAVGHLHDLIRSYFQDGRKWHVRIRYSLEEKPLGTAAPLARIENLKDDFLVLNGDVLTDLNFSSFFSYHLEQDSICTIATFKKPVEIDLGVLHTNKRHEVVEYIEKPTLHYNISMGVYAFSREALSYIPPARYYDFPTLIRRLLKENRKVKSYLFSGEWLDIGRPADFEIAAERFSANRSKFLSET